MDKNQYRHDKPCYACCDTPTRKHGKSYICEECYEEITHGKVGPPPGPTQPAYQKGLCQRQRNKLGRMSN